MLRLTCTLEAKFHDKDKPSWLVVFLPRNLGQEQQNVRCVTGRAVDVDVALPDSNSEEVEEDALLHVWWYAHRELLGDDNTDSDKFAGAATTAHVDFESKAAAAAPKPTQSQPYTARCGVASVGLKELLERQRCEVVVSDALHDNVATLKLALRSDAARVRFVPVHEDRHGAACDKWFTGCVEEYASVLSAFHKRELRDTNLTELPRHEFAGIVQEVGMIPIWAWIYGNTWWEEQQRAGEARSDKERFEQLLAIAEPLTGRHSDAKLRNCELLNEVVTLQTRATLYVLDTSMGRHRHDNSVDDWTNMRHSPAMFEAGADCEDLALEIVRECHALRRQSNELGKLLQDDYYTCLAIVTLRLSDDVYTYHAVAVQVPRVWSASSGAAVPILHEGTSYTTGAWQFDTADCTQQQFDNAHIQRPVESICKVPAQQVRSAKNCPYGHVVTLYCPELLESKGCAQIELSYQGRQGAPIQAFMRCDAEVKMNRIEAPKNWMPMVRYLMMQLPVPIHFHDVKEADGELPLPVRDGAFHCLFRGVDFTDAVRDRLLTRIAKHEKLQTRRIVLPGSGSVLVQCIAVPV